MANNERERQLQDIIHECIKTSQDVCGKLPSFIFFIEFNYDGNAPAAFTKRNNEDQSITREGIRDYFWKRIFELTTHWIPYSYTGLYFRHDACHEHHMKKMTWYMVDGVLQELLSDYNIPTTQLQLHIFIQKINYVQLGEEK